MKKWLLSKWDWFIYHRALASYQRLSDDGYDGFVMLHELKLGEIRSEIDEPLKRATETFHYALAQWYPPAPQVERTDSKANSTAENPDEV